jgi:hypothetical protein
MIKGRRKRVILIAGILLAAVLLVPFPRHYKDGGTVEYHAGLYQVIFWHTLAMDETNTRSLEYYYDGMEIRILGFTVYDGVSKMQYRYCE